MFDFSNAPDPNGFDLVPAGTIAVVEIKIRPGDAGEDGILKRTKSGDAEGLDLELSLISGKFAKRKFWVFLLFSGTTDGQKQMADRNHGLIKGILESARGIRPADVSETAKKARQIAGLHELNGMRFLAKVGIEPERNGYRAKNILDRVIRPDDKDWQPVEQNPSPSPVSPSGAAKEPDLLIQKPEWAK
jgi:hypothetical protein